MKKADKRVFIIFYSYALVLSSIVINVRKDSFPLGG